MGDKKIDRRTQRTRQLLLEAILSLVLEMSYEKITVQDIVDRANVGRSTFYTHYLDKNDLIVSFANRLSTELDQHISEARAGGKKESFFPSLILFKYIQKKPQISKVLIGGHGIEIVTKAINDCLLAQAQIYIEQVKDKGLQFTIPIPVLKTFLVSTLLSLIIWWLDNDMPFSAEEMNQMFLHLVLDKVETGG